MRPVIAWLLVGGLAVLGFARAGGDAKETTADEHLLKSGGISVDTESLLQFFRHRSLKEGDGALLEGLIRKLDSSVFKERDHAMGELAARGPVALPYLREELARKPSLETARRCELIVRRIELSQGPDHPAAAARILVARNAPGTIATLLHYVPTITDDWTLEEILASLGALTMHNGRLDPLLRDALKDSIAERRAAAAYILGRRGGFEQRLLVRSFLDDPDALVRRRTAQALAGKQLLLSLQDQVAGDEALVKKENLDTSEAALHDFMRKRTLKDEEQKRIRQLVADLGAPSYAARSRASKLLVKEGPAALAYLKPALESMDAEVARRAGLCIEEISRGPGPALPAAAVRLLARPSESTPAAAIRALLDYAPFADNETVLEEVCAALTALSVREARVDPLLANALRDTQGARRAAAAHVLSRVGTLEHQAPLRQLLDDPEPAVRLRAAQGLLLAGERAALPALVGLLKNGPSASLWQVEDTLQRLAGTDGPSESAVEGTAHKRLLAFEAWEKWLQAHATTIDLGRLAEGGTYLGLVTVSEYDSAQGKQGGQAWEVGRDGKERWKITGLMGAMDAQVLPNGRVLVAENSAKRVSERDLSGAIKWEYTTAGNPVACQRLPNGNTFIATYNQVMEITPDLRQVYVATRGQQFYIFSARKLRDGQVVAMNAQGTILRFDPLTGKDHATINVVNPNGGWCSVEALPSGRYLVAAANTGQVREFDAAGNPFWTVTMPGAFRATRLPNGNTLVASMTTRLVAEFDRNGNKRWEKLCEGRPWSVRFR